MSKIICVKQGTFKGSTLRVHSETETQYEVISYDFNEIIGVIPTHFTIPKTDADVIYQAGKINGCIRNEKCCKHLVQQETEPLSVDINENSCILGFLCGTTHCIAYTY